MPRPAEWVGSDLRSRAEVAHWLKMHGGVIDDPTGLIVGRMREELGKGRALSQLLADMERDGMLKREVRGRRTLSIKLLDDWGLADDLSSQPVYRAPDRLTESAQVDGNGDADVDLDGLAGALLDRVIKLAHAPASQGAELERLRERVSKLEADLSDARGSLAHWMAEAQEKATQADSMRETVIALNAALETADKAPARKGAPVRDRLKPKDRQLLERIMRDLSESD